MKRKRWIVAGVIVVLAAGAYVWLGRDDSASRQYLVGAREHSRNSQPDGVPSGGEQE